jgi:hypothetical protein
VLHIVAQKVTEQLAARINVASLTHNQHVLLEYILNAKLLPLQNESGLILLPQGKGDITSLARCWDVDCSTACRV